MFHTEPPSGVAFCARPASESLESFCSSQSFEHGVYFHVNIVTASHPRASWICGFHAGWTRVARCSTCSRRALHLLRCHVALSSPKALCGSAGAAVTKCHTPGGPRPQQFPLARLWGQKSNTGVVGCAPPKGWGGAYLPLPAPGGSGRPLACGCVTPVSACVSAWSSLCLCLHGASSSHKDTGCVRAHPVASSQRDLSAKILFPSQLLFTGTGG